MILQYRQRNMYSKTSNLVEQSYSCNITVSLFVSYICLYGLMCGD